MTNMYLMNLRLIGMILMIMIMIIMMTVMMITLTMMVIINHLLLCLLQLVIWDVSKRVPLAGQENEDLNQKKI